VLGVDGAQALEFGFDYLPTTCSFFKSYTLEVKTYPGDANVASFPWITVDEGQGPSGSPNSVAVAKLTVDYALPAAEGYYTVTVKSKLYADSTFEPEFMFKIYLSV
jgi:hypothetical protein